MKTTLITLAIFAQLSSFSMAHEFWIEPEAYQSHPGSVVRIGLRFGERFAGNVMPRVDDIIEKFSSTGPVSTKPIVGRSGATTSFARFETPGMYTLGYRSLRTHNCMDAPRFESYLQVEGLQSIVSEREKLSEQNKPGLEVFSRCAKSLLSIGSNDGRGFNRVLGFPLEIIPLANPYKIEAGSALPARVLLHGKPLPHAKVIAVSQRDHKKLYSAMTDDAGVVRFNMTDQGPWMFTTIHMLRAPEDVDADWESLWASLTFELAAKDSNE